MDNIDDDLIDLAILTKGKNGEIIAVKGLCENIIDNSNKKILTLKLK